MASRPPTPPLPGSEPQTPGVASLPSFKMGYFSSSFEAFRRDDNFIDWQSAFTLVDTIETFWDARVDLFERNLKKHSDKIKMRAEDLLKRTRTPSGELVTKDLEREIDRFKAKMSNRMSQLAAAWQSTKVVRSREKIAFFLGVNTVLGSALLFGLAPDWLHIVYTALCAVLLPYRAYAYKKKAYHYFLFDLCYYANILALAYLWLFPSSPILLVTSYLLAHGSLASAVITWRNSLVFHDWDKVTSVFIHIYPPFIFTVIRHFYPNASERFPALDKVPHMEPLGALLLSSLIHMIWQGLYWKFVLIDRKKKIESGQRMTSFSWLLHDKRGLIGRMLSSIKPEYREPSFMAGQLVYALITELPAIFLLYDSAYWSGVFLLFIFGVSVWNGGGFYIEVFGRKFERELEALRKELAEAALHGSGSSSRSTPSIDHAILGSDGGAGSDTETSPTSGSSEPTFDKVLHSKPLSRESSSGSLGFESGPESKKDQ